MDFYPPGLSQGAPGISQGTGKSEGAGKYQGVGKSQGGLYR